MKTIIYTTAFTLLLIVSGTLNAQIRSKGSDKVHTKEKKVVNSNRKADLVSYKNNMFIIDNAYKSNDTNKVILGVNNIKLLANNELDRANNNLIDLYAIGSKSNNISKQIQNLEKRIKMMQQRYRIFSQAKLDMDPTSKTSINAYRSMKQFVEYMEQNYNEFDSGNQDNNQNKSTPADVDIKLDRTVDGGMISSKSSNTKSNRNNEIKNPEIKKYIDKQRLNISGISKKSRELVKSLSEKDLAAANKIKQKITVDMQKTMEFDKSMSQRIDKGEFKDLELNNSQLKMTIQDEEKLIEEFKKLNFPKDNSRIMSVINDFNRLKRYL
ncbi:MAG: hypothetical protein C0595_12510 [Marinilabiliales bacterium]|nr:MAG: hypothetical protein C0595_12510 [Marinilabiliales bacterium]